MQTFLPDPDFATSAMVLDYRRLGKQRVEAKQLIDVLEGKTSAWSRHPAALMWEGYTESLKLYFNFMVQEWVNRGYRNNYELFIIPHPIQHPWWLGTDSFHASHRSNLLRKDKEYYGKKGWTEVDTLPYLWPNNLTKSFEIVK